MEQSVALKTSSGEIEDMTQDLLTLQNENCQLIEEKCNEITKKHAPANCIAYCTIHEPTFSPKEELIKACYDKKADMLVVGAKGISHSIREKVSDVAHRIGNVADFAVRHAPCDVLVIKAPHEY